jgi:hypothetical protein
VIDHPTLRTASVPILAKPFQPVLQDLVARRLAQ